MKSPFDSAFEDMSSNRKPPSNRILADVQCKVCQDLSSGKHYGIYSCDGCAGFFKRSIRKSRQYVCKSRNSSLNCCPMDKTHRNQCRACRLRKCLEAGMNKDAVQHERGPRNATKQRQAAILFKEPWSSPPSSLHFATPPSHLLQPRYFFGHPPASFLRIPTTLCQPVPKYPVCSSSRQREETVSELAAQLLFLNVNWLKAVPAFLALPLTDQFLLLSEGWRELFLISAAQCDLCSDTDKLMEAAGISSSDSEKWSEVSKDASALQNLITQIKQLNMDYTEYNFLKVISLFKTDSPDAPPKIRELRDPGAVSSFHDQAQLALLGHVNAFYPTQQLRSIRLQRLLPCLQTISNETIQKIFFRKLSDVPIEKVLCDLYSNDDYLRATSYSFAALSPS